MITVTLSGGIASGNEYGEGQEAEAVEAWIEANPDVLPELPSGR